MQNKIKIQISVTFLYSHTNWQKELRKQSHLQSYKKSKISRNEFNQGDKDPYIKNIGEMFLTLVKNIEKDI